MSLTVEQLNADSTFLLTFAPPFAPSAHQERFPGTFTILVDPWLDGESIIYHPKFASTSHVLPSALPSLADISSRIDLIVISQGLTDHCHKATLCSLPKDTNIKIVATPKAASLIQSWKHFQNPIVHVMKPYGKDKDDTILRIAIEPYSSSSAPGEITLTNVAQRMDISGVHNAIGITYCPPGTVLTAANGSTVNLADMTMMSLNKKASDFSLNRKASEMTLTNKASNMNLNKKASKLSLNKKTSMSSLLKNSSRQPSSLSKPLPPIDMTMSTNDRPSTSHTNPNRRANYEKVLSVLYTPHGTTRSSLEPYIEHHLIPLRALPLTALFHSMNTESNPWYMGGRICDGAPRAVGIAEAFGAKYWIGAHDEVKEASGYGTKLLQSQTCGVEEAEAMLRERQDGRRTEVVVLGNGGRRRLEG